MKLISTIAAVAFISTCLPAAADTSTNQQVRKCPSDPVTCWLTTHRQFDCRPNANPLMCWIGTYRDPKKPARKSINEGWN